MPCPFHAAFFFFARACVHAKSFTLPSTAPGCILTISNHLARGLRPGFLLGLLALTAATAPAQLVFDGPTGHARFSQLPVGHSYIIGLDLLGGTLLLSTTDELYTTPAAAPAWQKILSLPLIGARPLTQSPVVTDSATPGHLFLATPSGSALPPRRIMSSPGWKTFPRHSPGWRRMVRIIS
jgi:hypothetical protein